MRGMTKESARSEVTGALTTSMPRVLLHLEGAVLLMVATVAFFQLGQAWWVFALLLFAPDLGALGYLAGPRAGALAYNAAHTTAVPLVLGMVAWFAGWPPAVIALALVWLAHIGLDRTMGYGLKYPDRFKHNHFDSV